MTGVRRTIAVIISFRKSNKNSLERRDGVYRSSLGKNTLYLVKEQVAVTLSMNMVMGDRGSTVVKVLCYKSEGRWFDPRWC